MLRIKSILDDLRDGALDPLDSVTNFKIADIKQDEAIYSLATNMVDMMKAQSMQFHTISSEILTMQEKMRMQFEFLEGEYRSLRSKKGVSMLLHS